MSSIGIAASLPARVGRAARSSLYLTALSMLAVAVCVGGISLGALQIAPIKVLSILAGAIGLDLGQTAELREQSVVLLIRLPRVLLSFCVGGSLAMAGALMQALFRNPLADPGLIGVSSGAALGAVSVIVLGGTALGGFTRLLGIWALPLAAFLGGLLVMVTIYRLASAQGRTVVSTMLLAGIAVNAAAGAGTGFLTYLADDAQLRSMTFWLMGSLASGTWSSLQIVAPFTLIFLLLGPGLATSLNALLLGEAEATHLGVRVEWLKRGVIASTALVVGACTAFTGIIGFLGLVAPHLMRLMVGPDHRFVLPGSALLGGILLSGADLLARTIVSPAEVPIGIVTAILGAPFFLWLLLRERGTRIFL